jgi:hypothetical protein
MTRLLTPRLIALAALAWLLSALPGVAQTSTINPALPAQGGPLTSAPVRNNFLAAYNDINALYNIVGAGGTLYTVTHAWSAPQNFNAGATAPTRSPGDNTTNVATTAFVTASAGVGSIISGSTACSGCPAFSILTANGSSVMVGTINPSIANGGQYQVNGVNAIGLPSTDTLNASIAIGPLALNQISGMTSGAYGNIAIGYNALSGPLIVSSTGLVAIGFQALQNNSSGANNTAIGYQAMLANTTGANSTAIGVLALAANTTGGGNVGIGTSALSSNTSGGQNVAVGQGALAANIDGVQNVAIGTQAMLACQHSSLNVAIGISAMGIANCSITGGLNVAIGNGSLENNTDGEENTAVGSAAMPANTTGNFNSAYGVGALTDNTSGGSNVAMGTNAMFQNTSASFNTGVGANALSATQTGASNSAFGASALQNTTGTANTGVGLGASSNVTSGGLNTSLGFNSGQGVTTGGGNLTLGSCVGLSAAATNQISVCTGNGTLHIDWNRTTANAWTAPNMVYTAAAPTAAASQVAFGNGVATAGTTNCPSTMSTSVSATQAVQGCIVINVAGTARQIPFFTSP